ncbi:MAG: hypothetical protein DRN91_07555 [Candidatus Alkanophagales archaeon]|nr:MAG: hypothetical protein DRN91_07555 [Candidatus Alkanophagales archaeon]
MLIDMLRICAAPDKRDALWGWRKEMMESFWKKFSSEGRSLDILPEWEDILSSYMPPNWEDIRNADMNEISDIVERGRINYDMD